MSSPRPSLRARLRPIVEDGEGLAGRVFGLAIQALIIISLLTFAVETLPDLHPTARRGLRITELVFVVLFSIEYLLRIWVADRPLRFIFSVYGLVDLLAILPFYLGLTIDLRSVRVIRVMRLFRLLKLVRYTRALRRMQRAIALVREEMVLFTTAAMLALYLAGVGIYYFEREAQPEDFASVFDGLWWAIATLTTVGYGDIYPITTGGRLFTLLVLIVGLGIVAVPTGLIASALQATRMGEETADEDDEDDDTSA